VKSIGICSRHPRSRFPVEIGSRTRQRCWKYDWVLEFDIKGLFDNLPHDLLLKAVRRHVRCKWALLYIERWLTASMEKDGKLSAVVEDEALVRLATRDGIEAVGFHVHDAHNADEAIQLLEANPDIGQACGVRRHRPRNNIIVVNTSEPPRSGSGYRRGMHRKWDRVSRTCRRAQGLQRPGPHDWIASGAANIGPPLF
jgi:hypothetical protein